MKDLMGTGSITGGTLSVVPQSQGGDGGRVQKTTDPRALISKTDYDTMGRTLRTTANFVAFAPSDASDAQTEFTYDGSGHVVTRTAKLSYTLVNPEETTRYTYGVTRDSNCNTNANSCLRGELVSVHVFLDLTSGAQCMWTPWSCEPEKGTFPSSRRQSRL